MPKLNLGFIDMGNAAKIIKNVLEAAGDFAKDSGQQIAETVNPVKMMETGFGIKRKENEFSKYLKGLGGDLTEADIEKKKKEFEDKKIKEMEEAQKIINQALPDHLKPRRTQEPDLFEKNKQEEEMRKAQIVEMQKKQPKNILASSSKVTGVAARKRKPQSSAFESSKNVKVG